MFSFPDSIGALKVAADRVKAVVGSVRLADARDAIAKLYEIEVQLRNMRAGLSFNVAMMDVCAHLTVPDAEEDAVAGPAAVVEGDDEGEDDDEGEAAEGEDENMVS